jgi:hypothetical protein
VPIFCPAIVDSPYGDAALIAKSRGFNLTIDAVKDYVEFMKIAEKNQGYRSNIHRWGFQKILYNFLPYALIFYIPTSEFRIEKKYPRSAT